MSFHQIALLLFDEEKAKLERKILLLLIFNYAEFSRSILISRVSWFSGAKKSLKWSESSLVEIITY